MTDQRCICFVICSMSFIGCTSENSCESVSNETENTPEIEYEYDWSATEDISTDALDSEQDIDSPSCPDSWVLTYSLKGRIDITHTPLNIGNADAEVGGLDGDEIVLRIPNQNGIPDQTQVLITYFNLLQDFRVSVNMLGEIAIITNLQSTAYNECGLASGVLDGDLIAWDECQFGFEYGTTRWDPDDGAYGMGCIQDYLVEGTVICQDNSWLASCSDGWLEEGVNTLYYTYNQPMLDFQFDSNTLERFTMKSSLYGTEIPTYTNNRTWLSLEGELKRMELEPTPDCLCKQ